jgi:thioredoxin reductase (NADPH)
MLVRGSTLASSMSQYLQDEIAASDNIDVRTSTEVIDCAGDTRLEELTLRLAEGTITVRADALFLLIGARPHTAWLPPEIARDEQGYVLTGTDAASGLDRPPRMFETSVPGVFAVGDVRSSSVKRVASAVGEGSVVIQQVHQYLAGRPARVATG